MKNTSQELNDVSINKVLIQTKDLKHPSCSQTIFMGGTRLRSQAVNLVPIKHVSSGAPLRRIMHIRRKAVLQGCSVNSGVVRHLKINPNIVPLTHELLNIVFKTLTISLNQYITHVGGI